MRLKCKEFNDPHIYIKCSFHLNQGCLLDKNEMRKDKLT